MVLTRRSLFLATMPLIVAPALVKASSLMPISSRIVKQSELIVTVKTPKGIWVLEEGVDYSVLAVLPGRICKLLPAAPAWIDEYLIRAVPRFDDMPVMLSWSEIEMGRPVPFFNLFHVVGGGFQT